jgi:hypothetical protein
MRAPGYFWYHEYVVKRSIAKHGVELLRHVVPKVIRPLRSLWNEVIGFLFLSLAFLGAVSGYRTYRDFDGSPPKVLVMSYYGISSFLRARKISRS